VPALLGHDGEAIVLPHPPSCSSSPSTEVQSRLDAALDQTYLAQEEFAFIDEQTALTHAKSADSSAIS
jgi:hypothetical protein